MSNTQNSITEVIHALLAFGHGERQDALSHLVHEPAIKAALDAVKRGDWQQFHFQLQRPIENIIQGVVEAGTNSHQLQFLFQYGDFVESHIKELFVRHEGGACSADKSGTVMQALIQHFRAGKPIIFDYGAKYTYHLPKSILNTEADVLACFDALYRLYYGKPDAYLKFLVTLSQTQTQATDQKDTQ